MSPFTSAPSSTQLSPSINWISLCSLAGSVILFWLFTKMSPSMPVFLPSSSSSFT
jgi:hypothetical protein